MPTKETIKIDQSGVKMLLSIPRGRVRIADSDGNHISKPTIAKNISSYWVEWMITNDELKELIDIFLNTEDKNDLASRINSVNRFLSASEYAQRIAQRTTPRGVFEDFNIFEYEENFFSFEKTLPSNIKIRITFKMGAYTLAPHMFILFPFDTTTIRLSNRGGLVAENAELGSGSFAKWEPTKEVICAAVHALAYASEGHKEDLLAMVG